MLKKHLHPHSLFLVALFIVTEYGNNLSVIYERIKKV